MRFMKAILASCFLVAAVSAASDPVRFPFLQTKDGKEYAGVKVTAVEPDGVKIAHQAGVARIPLEKLPDEVQALFNFDPAKVAEYRANKAAEQQAASVKQARRKSTEQAAAMEAARRAKLEWAPLVAIVDQVTAGGLVCYRHFEAVVPGDLARSVARLGGRSGVQPARTDWTVPLFVEGAKVELARGDILKCNAARDGVKKIGVETLQRWIVAP